LISEQEPEVGTLLFFGYTFAPISVPCTWQIWRGSEEISRGMADQVKPFFVTDRSRPRQPLCNAPVLEQVR